MMKKILTIINTRFQIGLTYRFTILAYRVGEIAELLILILMWSAIYEDQVIIRGYTLEEMITYVLIGNLINLATRNFMIEKVAREIKQGKLSLFLVKPISYFKFMMITELGRIALPLIMSLTTQVIVLLFFLDKLILKFDPLYILLIIAMIGLAFIIELFISFLIAMIAFWTEETVGLQATISRLRKFFSGGYFPLSLLPITFVNISFLLPFAYSFFVPTQLYLKKIDLSMGLKGLVIQIIWIILLYGLIRLVWKRGLKKYEGVGI